MQELLVVSAHQSGTVQPVFEAAAASLSDEDGNTDHCHVMLLPSPTTTKDFQKTSVFETEIKTIPSSRL